MELRLNRLTLKGMGEESSHADLEAKDTVVQQERAARVAAEGRLAELQKQVKTLQKQVTEEKRLRLAAEAALIAMEQEVEGHKHTKAVHEKPAEEPKGESNSARIARLETEAAELGKAIGRG